MNLSVEGADGSRVMVTVVEIDTTIGDIIGACRGKWPFIDERRLCVHQFNKEGLSWVEWSDDTGER